MKFELNEQDLISKAKVACEMDKTKSEEFWYNFALNDTLAKEISNKTGIDYEIIVEDLKRFSSQYKELFVSFINNEISYQGKYWTFEEVYSYVENWQVKKYGQWKIFCKVLDMFDKTENLIKNKQIEPSQIKEGKNQLVGAIQSIGTSL